MNPHLTLVKLMCLETIKNKFTILELEFINDFYEEQIEALEGDEQKLYKFYHNKSYALRTTQSVMRAYEYYEGMATVNKEFYALKREHNKLIKKHKSLVEMFKNKIMKSKNLDK